MRSRLSFSMIILIFLVSIILVSFAIPADYYAPDYTAKYLPPTLSHFFGTDFLGHDMFFRTLKGLSISAAIGIISATISVIIATLLGTTSGYIGGKCDDIINWLIDLSLSIPHLMQLMLIAFMLGGGINAVIIAISITHWGALTRIIRAEVLQLKNQPYLAVSRSFDKSKVWIITHHILPAILPQLLTGFIVIFPHAILHEAAITFLGFGLPLDMPAIGTILAEAMKHLVTGHWWLTFFPGVSLLILVMSFYQLSIRIKANNHLTQGVE